MSRHGQVILMMSVMVGLMTLGVASAQAESPEHDFAGMKKCAMCHKSAKIGNQLGKWKSGPHAKAFETLGTPEAKAQAAEKGIDDPQTSGACLKCHATSYYFTEESVTSVIKPEEGVTCESCHGPGKDYMKMSVMKDHAKAVAAGLQDPGEATCLKCHNEESPTHRPFDYEGRQDQIRHPRP